jgi:hypothetical protein
VRPVNKVLLEACLVIARRTDPELMKQFGLLSCALYGVMVALEEAAHDADVTQRESGK